MTTSETINIEPVLERIVGMALADAEYSDIFESFCTELIVAGVPLLRAHLGMQTLHPLVSSVDLTWLRGRPVATVSRLHTPVPPQVWLTSPLYWMLKNRQLEMRRTLRDRRAVAEFPVFSEFNELGATDYFALITPFGSPDSAFENRDGIMTSWLSDADDGFSPRHLELIRRVQPYIALVSKLIKHDNTARNLVNAYLGKDAGQRVLKGQIRLGDVVHIPAVIWFSDLRDSTSLANRMPVEDFLDSLNEYFECTAGAILEQGGEVLRFIGDAVLAVFPITANEDPKTAAKLAISALHQAEQRLSVLNRRRAVQSKQELSFGVGLHVGDLLYGNIGVPSRIEFSVIGPAANEVSRLADLAKQTTETALASRAFKEMVDLPWRKLGRFSVKGISEGIEVFAPPMDHQANHRC